MNKLTVREIVKLGMTAIPGQPRSKKDIAKEVGVSDVTLNDMIASNFVIKAEVFIQLCDVCKVNWEELIVPFYRRGK